MALPGPREVPLFWQIATVGNYALPPLEDKGRCKVLVTPKLKEDEKKKDGKDKKKSTVLSVEPCDVEIELEFNVSVWAQVEPIIRGLKPDGQPRDIIHPATAVYDIGAVLLKSATPLEIEGGIGRISWSGTEWNAASEGGQSLILRRGSTGAEVSRWQQFLTEQSFGEIEGYSPVDGVFGTLTEDGTKAFQARESITVDGIVGPETFGAASKYGYTPPPPVTGGSGGVKTPSSSTEAATGAAGAAGGAAGAGAQGAATDPNRQAQGNVNNIEDSAADFLGGDENAPTDTVQGGVEGGGE